MLKILHHKKFITGFLLLSIFLGIFIFWHEQTSAPGGTKTSDIDRPDTTQKSVVDNKKQPQVFDKKRYSTSDPTSLWVVINKKQSLPSSFVPDLVSVSGGQVRPEVAGHLTNLLTAASDSGNLMKIISSYRSYSTQNSTYNNYVAQDGVAKADTYSARPGHSEHQTGLAVDVGNGTCDLEICFGNTKAGKWLAENAYKYGFIIRYPNNKTDITGYQYEPWHLRYVGIELSTEMQKTNTPTLEEFFGIIGGTSY